jgi:short-subunit dehydrogenase
MTAASSNPAHPSARPFAVVTGASGGIGLALARELASAGYDLLLVARSEARLRELASEIAARWGVAADPLVADLAAPAGVTRVIEAWRSRNRPPDVLVNNAGFGYFGPFAESAIATELEMMHLNMDALVHLTHAALADMRAGGTGRILNVASTAAFQPGPWMTVYYATKAFVLHFSEALAEELAGSCIRVTALCPGPTATGFEDRAGLGGSRLFRLLPPASAEAVARAGVRGMRAGRRIVIVTPRDQLLAQARRWLPRRWMTRLVGQMQMRRRGR